MTLYDGFGAPITESIDEITNTPATTDPTPWLHENGTRHATLRTAGPGVVHWMPRDHHDIVDVRREDPR